MSADTPAEELRKRRVNCCGGRVTIAYMLPVRLDASILPYIQHLGRLVLPFDQWRVLRLECQGYTVTGIKKMKEVRVSLENETLEEDLRLFEEALAEWIGNAGS